MKLGLIGLGNIGFHFACRLLSAGHDLYVYDRNEAVQQKLIDKGAKGVASSTALAALADVILLSLPLPGVVVHVATEIAATPERTVHTVVDLSTTGPSASKDVAAILDKAGIAMIGAPVSGGTVAAEHGTLAIMPSGPEAAYRDIEGILRVIGKKIFYLGTDPSLGQTMKIINNTLYAASLVASSEALVYGVKAGLDPKTMLDVLNASSGRSFATLERIPQCVLDRSFPVRFTTELLHKDVKMCIDEAEKLGVPMQVGPAARQFLAFAISQGDGPKDNAHIITFIENWAGVQFGKAPEA